MSALLYLDCASGVSGDMLLGALLDLGVDAAAVEGPLRALPLGEWSLRAEEVQRAGQRATRAIVQVSAEAEPARTLAEIESILDAGALPAPIRTRAGAVFRRLAEAEARVHGVSLETLHVHEVGRRDAVIDIVGTLLALDALAVTAVYCSALPLAVEGVARSGHGRVPLPAPATLEILSRAGAPIRGGAPGATTELVTPTGAALVAEIASFARPPLRLHRVGAGAGSRDDPDWPNLLRAWLGLAEGGASPEPGLPLRPIVVLETNVDDMTAEQVAFAVERVREAGALDVWLEPVAMKKGRSGLRITALARPEAETAVAAALLRETSTLGVRVRDERRYEAAREERRVQTPLGPARVKVKRLPGQAPSLRAEFEDCAALARSSGRPIGEVFAIVEAAAREALAGEG